MVTGSRAEYGLLRWVMQGIRDSGRLQLQVAVTGMHLASRFGRTFREIENDGFKIHRAIDIDLVSDEPTGISRSMGLGLIGFGQALAELDPDIMVVLGDRYEILSAVAAALVSKIPVAHIHGGEASEGAFDEAIRHAITKMSHLHFVAAEEYRRRVIQLGEQPERVFLVGGLGVDNIRRLSLLSRAQLERSLGFNLAAKNLLVTFHPTTLETDTAEQMTEILAALEKFPHVQIVFTMPNADTGSHALFAMILDFVNRHANAKAFESLGQLRYLSLLREVDGVVGNSSSGLTEAPSLGKATVNIGDRQRGRMRAASVIDCAPERGAIESALRKLYSPEFQGTLPGTVNPYGDGGASDTVVRVLEEFPIENILKKSFYDLGLSQARQS